MKTNFFIVGLAIASMLLVTSCSKSDDGDGDGDITVTTSPLAKIGIVSPVKTIESGSDEGKYDVMNFVYNNNFLESVSGCTYRFNEPDDDISLKVGYNPLKFNLISDESEFIFSDIKTNDAGSVTQFTAKSTDGEAVLKYQFEYDNENQLTRCKLSFHFTCTYFTTDDTTVADYTWKNGDIVSATEVYTTIQDGKKGSRNYSSTLSYDSQELNSGLYMVESLDCEDYEFSMLLYTGLFGRPTKHVPNKEIFTDYDGSVTVYNYVYTKNSNGQITKVGIDNESGYLIFGY